MAKSFNMSIFRKFGWPVGIYFGFWFFYFLWFWSHAITMDEAGNLVSGHVNIWGDWALHFSLGSSMAYRTLLLFESPLLIHAPFNYPFLCDFISALLIRLGVPFFNAFTIPSFFFSVLIVFSLFWFYRTFFKSSQVAIISSLIFIFNGGIGFWFYIQDLFRSTNFWNTLFFPPKEYTGLRELNIKWISVISSMFIPQRSFQMGFPLAVLTLTLIIIFLGLMSGDEWKKLKSPGRLWILTGISLILGLMPIIQTYSFMALFVILGFWLSGDVCTSWPGFVRSKLKFWIYIVLITSVVAIPLFIIFIWPNLSQGSFFKWDPGGFGKTGKWSWIKFWWENWGITPFFSVVGAFVWIFKDKNKVLRVGNFLFSFPFFLLFIATNLFLFQPWDWDNTKVLVWASLGMSGFCGYLIWEFFLSENFSKKALSPMFRKIIGGFLLLFMTASGLLDAFRIIIPSLNRYQMYSAEDMYLANWVRQNSAPDSVWLTAPYHNHWLPNLTGRKVLMGYEGWLWTHGYKYGEVLSDLQKMYGNPSSKNLFKKYGVNYVVVGPIEERDFKAEPEVFSSLFEMVLRTENYRIFSSEKMEQKKGQNLGKILILDKTVKVSGPTFVGLREKFFGGIYFQGKLLKERNGVTHFDFDYPYDELKPFKSPFSIVWEGLLQIEEGGVYGFSMASDDGSWLAIDDQMVIDNGGQHQVEEKSTRVFLISGFHTIKIKYYDHHGGAVFGLKWQPPNGELTEIPPTSLISPN